VPGGPPAEPPGCRTTFCPPRAVTCSRRGVAGREIIGNLIEGDPPDALVLFDVVDNSFEHQKDLRMSREIGVEIDGEYGMVQLPVDPVELVAPHLFQLSWVDPAMTVGVGLDEHHRRQVIEVPVRRNLDQIGLLAADQRLHPVLGIRGIIDFGPGLTHTDPVDGEVVVHQRVVVPDAPLE